jgi:hypothetical protein
MVKVMDATDAPVARGQAPAMRGQVHDPLRLFTSG